MTYNRGLACACLGVLIVALCTDVSATLTGAAGVWLSSIGLVMILASGGKQSTNLYHASNKESELRH